MKKIARTLLGLGAALLATAGWALAAGDVLVTYTPDDTLFPNPERGFLHASEAHSWNAQEQDYVLLDRNTLQGYRQNENITLIKRSFYLEGFVNSPIPQWYLDKMQLDFNTLRAVGLKAVIRFAYANRSFVPPYGDADKARVLEHLAQLQPILQNNVDVIDVVEAGFIGNWGEWFFTDYFVADPNNPANITPTDYDNRREVLEGILNVLPTSRMVQLRTPFYKYKVYGTLEGSPALPVPLNASNAHDGSYIARTGHHNDCFLGNETDGGTYGVWVNIADDKDYLAAETKYVPMGGEICEPGSGQSRFDCQSAMKEMAQFHWSYLNVETGNSSTAIYDGWDTGGCLPEIKRLLGYRFALVQGTYPEKVTSGGAFSMAIQLQNDGWSSPINPRLVNLVLRKTGTGDIHTIPLIEEDPRFWLAGTTQTINHRLIANVPPGDYELLLHLPDAEPTLSARPEYAIRLANDGVWEETTGYNNLGHTLTVTQAQITKAATTTSVVSSKNPSAFGTAVILTSTVTAAIGAPPDGEAVTFKQGSTLLGTGTLSGGTATLSTSTLGVGEKKVTAVYGGDANFTSSKSEILSQVVGEATTTTTLTSSQNPSNFGQSVTFTVTVSPQFSGTPTGTVTFSNGSTKLGTVSLSGGAASYTTTKLAVGRQPITAVYSGSTSFTTSTSGALSQAVNQANTTTTTTLTSSQNPSKFGQSVTFTVTVSPQFSGTPTGTVTFNNGSTKLGTVSLSGGAASYTTSKLAVGTEPITAVYNGSTSFTTSTSGALSQAVNQANTTTTLVSSLNPSTYKQAVTFTATVSPQFSGTVTGTVTFYDGTTLLKTVTLSGGKAKFTTSTLTVGAHTITATYNGSTSFNGSSASLTQTVN